ncbi:uncharacterized protein HMPREF1541_07821 [Cyphellophora europaea CBS 101466]|uniref:Major facilitator superfamily (MFS) profile domain-containing protein n=1 Tax=Cyphellophora europaea (strain CBS 101466) TaxID=1220924 RepID=W2RM75_CYPE1|nr:uncharacterized protein HMPREF1541_07821 [Cyphellophora europaea CBS 101466]ETN36834.1 hypothetical protein HMPREF1541_07821 [Cyphellophora europaea CBS 101466]
MASHDMSMTALQMEDEVHGPTAPDPTNNLNPQNWSPWKKRFLFCALLSSSILCDGGMTWGATLVIPQSIEWHLTPQRVATSLNYGILLQGVGGVLAVPLMDAFGRLPLWFWPQILTLAMVVGCCLAPTFDTFTAFRAMQGLFGTMPQIIGLPIIHDIYLPRDWPAMINIWGTTFLVGPFLGPALAGYLLKITHSWRDAFRVLAGLYGASTLLVLAFGRETYYNRSSGTQQIRRAKAFLGIGNTEVHKASTMIASSRLVFILAFLRLPLLLVGLSSLVNFTWPIGITTTISTILYAPPYLFNNVEDASMRFAGVIGALLGYAVGYLFNERISRSRTQKTDWRPEYRLHGVWLPVVSSVLGLLTYGLTLHFQKSWVGLAFGWVMVNIGLVASTV